MSSPGPGGSRFHLGFSTVIAETIRQLQREASAQDRGREFLHAIREIVRRLEGDPMEFGEPLYYLPALRLYVRVGAIRPLYVDFAVSADRPRVFMKAVKLLAPHKP
jgi:hypothetical protein